MYAEVGAGPRGRRGFVGWIEWLNAEKNEEGYLMIGVRPKGHIDGLYSDMTLNSHSVTLGLDYFKYSQTCAFILHSIL